MIRRLTEIALSRPSAFAAYQAAMGAPRCHQHFIVEQVAPAPGERVLDIGCGVGASLPFVPDGVEYVGVDISPRYIEAARRKYGRRGTFVCADLRERQNGGFGVFDKAFAFGVLHHLSDKEIAALARVLSGTLAPHGTFVSIDPCRHENQAAWSRFLMAFDRGRYIRTEAGYRRALAPCGPATTELRLDLLNLPYAMVVCRVVL